MTTSHHPLCDDNGWDHPGECVVETDFYALDETGPYASPAEADAHDERQYMGYTKREASRLFRSEMNGRGG